MIHIRINTINILDRQLLGLYSHPCLILKDYEINQNTNGPKEQVHSISHTTNGAFLGSHLYCIYIL